MRKNYSIFETLVLLAIAFLFNENVSLANGKIPFCKSLTVAPEANEVIITVPENERLVMLKLYADYAECEIPIRHKWHLDIDDQILLSGTISSYSAGLSPTVSVHWQIFQRTYVHDFPDSCVVVPAGKTLIAVNKETGYKLDLTLIGYLEKIDTDLVSDLNGDHKVDFADFAILANEWLATSS